MRPKPNFDIGDFDFYRFKKEQRYYAAIHLMAEALSAISLQSNALYGIPFPNPVNTSWDRVAVNCTTLATSALARLGIYEDNGAFYPGVLISEFGEINLGSTGVKEITISPKLRLQKGEMYWMALQVNGYSPALRGMSSGSLVACYFGLINDLATGIYTHWRKTGMTYGNLPNPFTSGGAVTQSNCPAIFMRNALN